MRPKPNDLSARGPWSVGARTVSIDDLTVEVFYPSDETVGEAVVYDIRDALPPEEAAKITDEANPWQPCECGRDLSIDANFGPYPVVLFIHGTAGWRTQSLRHLTHWASRGFIVVTADHPGLWLRDLLAPLCGGAAPARDLESDVRALLAAVRGETDELSEFSAVMDAGRIGMVGHSAGGGEVGGYPDEGNVIIPLAAGPEIEAGSALQSVLFLGGTADSVVPFESQGSGFAGSVGPKRLVGIENAGHLVPSEICTIENAAGQNLLEVASEADVCGAQAAGFLFQCDERLLDDATGWAITEYATAGAFEETLHCSPAATEALSRIQTVYPDVAEFDAG